MRPERTSKIGGILVEEFYWNGKMVVYMNNHKYDGTFDQACEKAEIIKESRKVK